MSPEPEEPFERRGWAIMAAVLAPLFAGAGCLGEALVDAHSFDPSGRDGMSILYEDDAFRVFGYPMHSSVEDVPADMQRLGRVRANHLQLLGLTRQPEITIYLHTADSYGDTGLSTTGWASPSERTIDLVWAADREVHWAAAHELAHLAVADAALTNPRPVLNEGIAEYLTAAVPDPYYGSDTPGTIADDFDCAPSTSLADMFSGSGWYRERDYKLAGFFTELVIEQVGFGRYLDAFYVPSATGLTADAEARLRELTGRGFADTQEALRVRAGCAP